MVAKGEFCKISVGLVQSIPGSFSQAHIIRSQLTRSSVLLNAEASALSVLRTTLGIFLLDHAIGQITESWFSAIFPSVVKTIVPCLDETPFFVSKEASEKPQKATWSSGIGTTKIVTGWFLASSRTRFASSKSSMCARGIADCSNPTLAQMSGLVCTAAYCRDPQSCLRHCLSDSVTGACGVFRRWRWTWMGSIRSTYPLWHNSILPSPNCRYRIPQKSNSPILKAPNEYFWRRFPITSMKYLSPPPSPSSTWIPKTPLTQDFPWSSGVTSAKTQPSRGHGTNPSSSKVRLKAWYQRYGPSIRPYAPPWRPHCSPSFMPRALEISVGGYIPSSLPSPSPFRKAVEISKFNRGQRLLDTFCKISCFPSLLRVGASFGTTLMSGSSKPRITNRAFGLYSVVSGNGGFQLRIHLQRMIRFGGRDPFANLFTVSCSIHARTSLSLACWNKARSCSLRSLHFTSTRCFLAVVATKIISAKSLSARSCLWGISGISFISISHTPGTCEGYSTSSPKQARASLSSSMGTGTPIPPRSPFSGIFVGIIDGSSESFSPSDPISPPLALRGGETSCSGCSLVWGPSAVGAIDGS